MAKPDPIPKGMHTVTPNLTIKGCAEALDFYKRALGADEVMRMPSPDGKAIWHAEFRVGDSIVFANDEMPGGPARAPSPSQPAPVGMWLYVPDCDAAFQRAVQAGAKPSMPPTRSPQNMSVGGMEGFAPAWTARWNAASQSGT